MSRVMRALTAACLAWQWCGTVTAAPFDVLFRPDATAPWTFYGGRSSREAADATAIELKQLGGYETKIVAGGTAPAPGPTGEAAAAVPATRAIAIGSTPYVSRAGRGYMPGWYRPWGGWTGAGWGRAGWGGGWGGGYGGYAGSSTHHHSSSHHHHHSHQAHHAGHAGTNHPAHAAGGRAGGAGHRSASRHAHSHSHSHSHHSHAGHHGHGGHHK